MDLLEEYEKNYKDYIYNGLEEYADKINKPYKISGNIFAHTIRNNISEIVKPKYDVSVVNSYIKGSNIEWDLLILKNNSQKEKNINVYSSENVICALEFKSSGAIIANNPAEATTYLNKYVKEIEQINEKYKSNIKYGYISLCEIPDNLKAMKDEFCNNCFWIIEGYYGSRKKIEIKKKNDLKIFIENLLN